MIRRALCCLAIAVAACNGDTPTSPTTTDTTTTATVASPAYFEDFSGAVGVSSSAFYSFTVTQYGTVNVTLASMGGTYVPATVTMGLGIGVPEAEGCPATTTINTAPGAGPHLSGTYQPGVYCVRINDVGNLYAAGTFVVSIAYP
jgi:hypothetical protein